MKQYDIIDVKIDSIAAGGEGIAKVGGTAVFVEDSVPGDFLKIKISKIKNNYAKGEIAGILDPSPNRISPKCKYYYVCGACQMQHIKYDEQLKIKTKIVKDAISRIEGISSDIVLDIVGSENPWGYRNKMQYPIREIQNLRQRRISLWLTKSKIQNKSQIPNRKNEAVSRLNKNKTIAIGYYKKGTHEVVDIEECPVLHPFLNEIAASVRQSINKLNIPIYDEDMNRGLLRHILARVGFDTNEAILTVIVSGEAFKGSNNFADNILDNLNISEKEYKLKGILKNINTRKTNVILGDHTRQMWGQDFIFENVGVLKYKMSATSFFQVNPLQAEKLYDVAKDFCSSSGNETIVDAYCGTGSIALWLSKYAKEIYGIEEVESAISDAKENAAINNIKNVFFKCATVEKGFKLYQEAGLRPDIIILDPPRAGCSRQAIDFTVRFAPKKIIYVSCDPATLARDLKLLGEKYNVEKIQPVDMFPQTAHIECAALLVKK